MVYSLVMAFYFASTAMAAQNCRISVGEKEDLFGAALVRRGYELSNKERSEYELLFEDLVVSPVYENGGESPLDEQDTLLSYKGQVVMKIYKTLAAGQSVLQFAVKSGGSVSTCRGQCIQSMDQGTKRLFYHLIRRKHLISNLPTCQEIK